MKAAEANAELAINFRRDNPVAQTFLSTFLSAGSRDFLVP